jgi:hypothetical protein
MYFFTLRAIHLLMNISISSISVNMNSYAVVCLMNCLPIICINLAFRTKLRQNHVNLVVIRDTMICVV